MQRTVFQGAAVPFSRWRPGGCAPRRAGSRSRRRCTGLRRFGRRHRRKCNCLRPFGPRFPFPRSLSSLPRSSPARRWFRSWKHFQNNNNNYRAIVYSLFDIQEGITKRRKVKNYFPASEASAAEGMNTGTGNSVIGPEDAR